MASEYFVLVTGNGETSRANIEALMEDHYYAKGNNGTLVLAYERTPTKSQTLTAQYAVASEKKIITFCNDDAQTLGMHGVEQKTSSDPITAAVEFVTGKDAVAFLLWDEQDDQCFSALKKCKVGEVLALNLCDGLVPLNDIIKTPVKPEEPVEVIKASVEPVVVKEVSEASIKSLEDELSNVLKRAQEIVQEMVKCRQNSL